VQASTSSAIKEATMKAAGLIGKVLLVLSACATPAYASDPVAVYARVDKVVLEPNSDSPQAIQIWGVFALARPDDRNDYLTPVRGYLYFTLKDNSRAARAEWADLKSVAGSGQVVSFGSRYDLKPRVRQADEKPHTADPYIVSIGLAKAREGSGNPPVRALLAFPR
jgi:hypothetical protein